jgi:predicted nuclease of predicted toxin-antitoxin system
MTGDRLFIFLYTDEDVTNRLAPLLREQGYEALSSAEAGNDGLTDAEQLAFATGQGWAILTYNLGDFSDLDCIWSTAGREHAGIVVSQQFSRNELGEFLRQVSNLLEAVSAQEMWNTVRHLQGYR